jgi:CelD/BcsL family acetyltransferase involved in cellulose biosynthesis
VRFHGRLDDSSKVLEDYFDLYARGWQKSERHEGFFREALALLSSLGSLRLFFFEIDERPVAAQLLAVEGERAYNLKNFFDSAYRKQSPGTVLAFDALQRTIETDRVRSIDYMKGDQEYKARWASELRKRFDWTIPLDGRGTLALGAWRLLGGAGQSAPDPD